MKTEKDSWVIRAFGVAVLVALLFMSSAGCGHRSVGDYLTAGGQAMRNNRLADAESDYQQAAKIAPQDPRPLIALGNLYMFGERKPQQGQDELMKALELAPQDAKAHAALADAYDASGQPGLAEAQYRAAVALSPADAGYRISLGAALQKGRKLGAAEAEYRTAVGLQPRNAQAHLALAALLNSEPNRKDEARAEYAQVKALNPALMPAANPVATTPPAAVSTAALATASAAAVPPLKDFNHVFLLTHNSPVYESMSSGARALAQVHRGKYVRVTGVAGPWLRIRLRNRTVGFIPATAAE